MAVKKELRLEREKCVLCGICAGSCPVGSIAFFFQHIQAKFNLNQSLCQEGCRICVEQCPQKALSFDKNLTFYGNEKEWVVKCNRCNRCKAPLPKLEQKICPKCKREEIARAQKSCAVAFLIKERR